MKAQDIWNLVKPVIIIVLGALGYFFACDFFTRNVFIAIVVLSFILRGGSIINGIKAIIAAFKN